MIRKWFIAVLWLLIFSPSAAVAQWSIYGSPSIGGATPLRIGGGGFVTHLSIANDGSKYVGVDVYGAYYFNPATTNCGNNNLTGCWQPIFTSSSLPSPLSNWIAQGAYDIAAAPSNGADVYTINDGYFLASTNHGTTWTLPGGLSQIPDAGSNIGNGRLFGKFIAVDPQNPAAVVVGTPDEGTYFTQNSGAAFTNTGLPPSTSISFWTSTSSNSISTGSKTFTTTASCSSLGIPGSGGIQMWNSSSPANQMQGTITSCTGSSLVVNITSTWGNGTGITTWDFNLLGSSPAGTVVAFDPTSSVVGGFQQGIYACVYGVGVYHSTNGGTSFTLTSSGPTTCRHMIVDQFGQVWATDNTSVGTKSNIWQYASGTWTNFNLGTGNADRAFCIAANPGSASTGANYVVSEIDVTGAPIFTNNNGGAWTGPFAAEGTTTSGDVPWLAQSTSGSVGSTADCAFDPSQSNVLFVSIGAGVIYTTPPTTNTSFTYTDRTAAIENMVANWITVPPYSGSHPFVNVWDFSSFNIPDPTQYASSCVFCSTSGLTSSFANSDWATGTPTTLVTVPLEFSNDHSGISTDGGSTWNHFPSVPSEVSSGDFSSGNIAALDFQTFLWEIGNQGDLYCTANGGTTWIEQSINSIPNGQGWTGSGWGGFAYYLYRVMVAHDGLNAGTGYVMNDSPNIGSKAGLYQTTNNCTSWTQVTSGVVDSPYEGDNSKLQAVPGVAGDLFFTTGPGGNTHPNTNSLWECVISAGSCTWTVIANVAEPWTFAFGAPKPGGSGFPAIFIIGWVTYASNQGTAPNNCVASVPCFGIHRSDDHGATWNYITTYPGGSLDQMNSIQGDPNVYGKFYVGFQGSSFQ